MSAELAARRTAAAAVLADFGRYASGEVFSANGIADWQTAALRLAAELRSVLDQLGSETPGAAEQLAAIRAIFDVFDWETDDRQYALEAIEQILLGDDQ